jgi:hypothetical protein
MAAAAAGAGASAAAGAVAQNSDAKEEEVGGSDWSDEQPEDNPSEQPLLKYVTYASLDATVRARRKLENRVRLSKLLHMLLRHQVARCMVSVGGAKEKFSLALATAKGAKRMVRWNVSICPSRITHSDSQPCRTGRRRFSVADRRRRAGFTCWPSRPTPLQNQKTAAVQSLTHRPWRNGR